MTYVPTVNPTTESPTGHASLTDGTTTLNIVFYNPNKITEWFNKKTNRTETIQGGTDKLAIKRYPIVESALKTYEGDLTYDSENPPYFLSAQDDWSGGRGQEDFERDKTRFFDGWNANTINGEDGVILNGLPTYSTGHYYNEGTRAHVPLIQMPGSVVWRGLYGTRRYISRQFTSGAGEPSFYDIYSIRIPIKKVGSPTSKIYVTIYANASGPPNPAANLFGPQYTDANTITDSLGVIHEFYSTSNFSGAAATTFHLVVYSDAADTATDHWEVGCDSTATNYRSSTGAVDTWTSETGYAPYYIMTLPEYLLRKKAHFFSYKGAWYMATQPDNGTAGRLFINGYRNAAADNSGDKTYLMTQSTPPWAADEINNKVIVITGGPGAQSVQNWRNVYDSTTTAATAAKVNVPGDNIDEDWDVAHTTSTDYVVLGCNTWTEITSTGLTKPVTDVKVVNEVVYLAQGGDAPVWRFFAVNNAGTWTNNFSSAGAYADFLEVVHDSNDGEVLWMGRVARNTQYTSELIKAIAPLRYSSTEMLSGTVLDDCQDTWAETTVSGVTNSFANNEVVMTITDTFATGVIASEAISSTDVRPFNLVCFRITSSVDLAEGILQIVLDDTAQCASATIAADLPEMRAGVWYDMAISIDPVSVTGSNAIISVGLQCTADQNKAMVIKLTGPMRVCYDTPPKQLRGRLTGLQKFGSPELLHALQEDEIGYVENDLYTPLEIPGLAPLSSPDNGIAHEDFDGYLAFSFHKGIMLYYGTTQKYIGPDNDAGFPSDRIGKVVKLISMGSRLYVAYDGGFSNYSSVICYDTGGFHEVFRAPVKGYRIRNIAIQSIPGRETQRLWISMVGDIVWVPISRNPYETVKVSTEYDMRFVDEGAIELSYIYTGRRELQKLFHSMKVWAENMSAGNYYIEADYKLDGDTTWTAVAGDFDTVPVEEITLSASTPPTSKGKRIRIRLHIVTNDNTKTPRVKTVALEMVAFANVKYGYAFYYRPADGEYNVDLQDVTDTTFANTEAIFDKIDEWASSATPLTLNCVYAPYHNKTVIINPMQSAPLSLDLEVAAGEGRETHVGYIQCIEA